MGIRDTIKATIERAADAFLHGVPPSGDAIVGGSLLERTLDALLEMRAELVASERRRENVELDLLERTEALDAACDRLDEYETGSDFGTQVHRLLVDVGGMQGPYCKETQLQFLERQLKQASLSRINSQAMARIEHLAEAHGMPTGLTVAAWLEQQLNELKAAREAVQVLRVCVRDDIVIVGADTVLNRYDAWSQSTTQTNGGGHG